MGDLIFWIVAVVITVALVALIIILYIKKQKNNVGCSGSDGGSGGIFESNNPILNHISKEDLDTLNGAYQEYPIIYIENFINQETFSKLQRHIREVLSNKTDLMTKWSFYIRKAKTMSADDLKDDPVLLGLYQHPELLRFIQLVTGTPFERVNCNDQASMNLLVYDQEGDHINWHQDPNHYHGKRITVLICVKNTCGEGGGGSEGEEGLSASEFHYMLDGKEHILKTKENSIVIFDGSAIKHKATSISSGDLRILVSFTYCDICEEYSFNVVKKAKEYIMGY